MPRVSWFEYDAPMASAAPEFELEFAEPNIGEPCPCCGGLTVTATGFVSVNEGAYAVYSIAYANTHPEHELALLVSVGDWSEGADPGARQSFYCRLRPDVDSGSYQLGLSDAGDSRWAEAAIFGQKLTRADALAHPLKATVLALTDAIGDRDPRVRGYFSRVAAGDSSVPLECGWRLPDAIARLDEATRESEASFTNSFASLGARRFIRVLAEFPVEGYGGWSHGLWLEVDPSVHDQVKAAWNDPDAYMQLDFQGVLANDLMPEGMPHAATACAGVTARIKPIDPDELLRVSGATDEGLHRQLTTTWPKAEFIRFAVDRGYL